jgi:hypothetical protein
MTFEIDFLYDGLPYRGLVTTTGMAENKYYFVKVESENQELYLNIVGKPCGQDKMDWCFKEPQMDENDEQVDKNFLMEIGEAIEKYQSTNGEAVEL